MFIILFYFKGSVFYILFIFKLLVLGLGSFVLYSYITESLKVDEITNYKTEEEKKGAELEDKITALISCKKDYKVLTNIIIPNLTGKTTEIDILILSRKGFYVIEAKNYFGAIAGNKDWKKWVVTYNRKKGIKRSFRNPIYQNLNHIKCLRAMFPRFRFENLVVFGENSSLSQELFKTPNVKTFKGFEYFLNVALNKKEDILTKEEVESVYDFLCRYKEGDREAHIEFVNSIKAKMSSKKEQNQPA